jgi:hypothetical protein
MRDESCEMRDDRKSDKLFLSDTRSMGVGATLPTDLR